MVRKEKQFIVAIPLGIPYMQAKQNEFIFKIERILNVIEKQHKSTIN